MEIPVTEPVVRICEYKRLVKLKDGTVKEIICKQKYVAKHGRVVCGKNELKKKITDCKDREKIEKIKAYCEELGL